MSKTKNKNLTIKILALFISILLWSYVRGEVNPNIIREFKGVNVEIMNEKLLNDEGLVIIGKEDIEISVKVSGRRSDVNSVSKKDITAEVDLSEVTRGSKKVLIDVQVPFRVELEDISDRYASFEVDSVITVEREVEINIEGTNKDDIVKESIVTPKSVKINGPSIYIDNIARVVANISADNISSSGIMKVPVKLLDKNENEIEELKVNPGEVEVSLSLLSTKEVTVEAKLIGNLAEGYNMGSVSTNPNKIVIKGLEEDIKDIETIETEDVDITNIKKDESINVALKLPEGIKVNEEKVVVNIKLKSNKDTKDIKETKETKDTIEEGSDTIETTDSIVKEVSLPIDQIELRNINQDLESNFDVSGLGNIGINIEGNKDIIENLDSKDITISLDLNGLEEGTHEVNIIVDSIKDIKINSVNPESIKIKLEIKE